MGLTEQPARRRTLPAAGSWARGLLPETGPQRAISLATFVNTFGSGMFMTSSALFFTQVVGLTLSSYTTGLFAGSMAGLVVGLFAGRLADQEGACVLLFVVLLFGVLVSVCCLFVGVF